MGSNGHVSDFSNAGALACIANMTMQQVQSVIETNNHTWLLHALYFLSILGIILNISCNDMVDIHSHYYRSQWSVMMASPLFYLTMFICIFVSVLPRYIHIILQKIWYHPEFTKINSSTYQWSIKCQLLSIYGTQFLAILHSHIELIILNELIILILNWINII